MKETLIGQVVHGTPVARTLGNWVGAVFNTVGSMAVHLTQALTRASQVTTFEEPGDGVGEGTINVAAAATAFSAAAIPCIKVSYTARLANVGAVYVGGSTIAGANEGVELQPGDGWEDDVTDVSLLYGWAVNANDDIDFKYTTRA